MAWTDTLLEASFKGVAFECQRTQDAAQRDTAQYEYPYRDGADIEDLGRGARRLDMTAVFWGDDYETRLRAFLAACDTSGAGELVHPVFGSIKRAQLLEWRVAHDADNPDFCTVELGFAEDTPGAAIFARQLPVQQAASAKQLAGNANTAGTDAFASAVSSASSATNNRTGLNALRSVMVGTLSKLRSQVHGYTTSTLDVIDYPRSFAADIVGLLSGLADLRSFDGDTIMSDWHALALDFDDVVKLPASIANRSSTTSASSSAASTGSVGGDTTADDIALAKPLPVLPVKLAQTTALLVLTTATTLASVAADVLANEAEAPRLPPTDIERIANDTRTRLQAAIDSHRTLYEVEAARPVTEAAKDVALAVQEAARAVIDLKPPLVRRTLGQAGNFHLVAHRWYGDYTRAVELARLNPDVRNPNTLAAGDTLNAYAQ